MRRLRLGAAPGASTSALAALHARAFAPDQRPWTAPMLMGLVGAPGAIWAERLGRDGALLGFGVVRVAGPEAELLTLAAAPEARREGVGAALLAALLAEAAATGAHEIFLEVRATAAPARRLYDAFAFRLVGCRRSYYRRPDGGVEDALILRRGFVRRS